AELLRAGDNIAVLSPTNDFSTRIMVVDAHDPHALEVVRQVDVEGHYLSARQVGDTIRLVVTQHGPAFDFTYPPTPSPAYHATTTHLYVATSTWQAGADATQIHEFDVSDPEHSKYVGSGSVSGHLLRPSEFAAGATIGQWSMSEQGGDLRVATTVTNGSTTN